MEEIASGDDKLTCELLVRELQYLSAISATHLTEMSVSVKANIICIENGNRL